MTLIIKKKKTKDKDSGDVDPLNHISNWNSSYPTNEKYNWSIGTVDKFDDLLL